MNHLLFALYNGYTVADVCISCPYVVLCSKFSLQLYYRYVFTITFTACLYLALFICLFLSKDK